MLSIKNKNFIIRKNTIIIYAFILFIGLYLVIKFYGINISINAENKPNDIKLDEDLDKVFHDFFIQSSQQLLIPKNIIFKTMRYMIEERDEYDPELVEFVRSLIVPPPKGKKINLSNNSSTDFSQLGQSKYIDKLLGEKRDGFFVESGGFDGEGHSNSVFFELERGWNGILIEPIPSFYSKILTKNRQIFALNACLASKKPLVAKFRFSHALSSRTFGMRKEHDARIDTEFGKKKIFIYVPCFSLNTILKALDVNKVDYFSLDVEGGELTVLHGLDFKNIDIKAFSIEYNGFKDEKIKIQTYMEANGYKVTKDDKQDIYFMKN